MFEVFGLTIHFYGITAALGIYLGTWVVSRFASKHGVADSKIWDGAIWGIVPGIVGARLYHVIDYWHYYLQNPDQIIAIWNGGMGIFGGLLGGGLGILIYTQLQKLTGTQVRKLFDLIVFGIPVGQAIGRLGNYFNQELYGLPTQLPWGIFISPENRVEPYLQYSRFHPLFAYEAGLNALLFIILFGVYTSKRHKLMPFLSFRIGSLGYLGIYLVGYGLIRILLEFLRVEYWTVGNISVAQIIGIVMVFMGSILVYRANKLEKSSGH